MLRPSHAPRFIALLAAAVLLAACAPAAHHNVHHSLLEPEARPAPKNILLVPADVTVKEISAGGVTEEVPEWTESAQENVNSALREQASSHEAIELIPLPELGDEERAVLAEHVALYNIVAGTALNVVNSPAPAWRHKREHFDYTLGPGLRFLTQKTDAEAALLVVGEDAVSSAGRKAAFVIGAAMGVSIPMGYSFLSVGVVDLETGNIMWFDYDVSTGDKDLREADDARTMVRNLLEHYPGLEGLRQRVAQRP